MSRLSPELKCLWHTTTHSLCHTLCFTGTSTHCCVTITHVIYTLVIDRHVLLSVCVWVQLVILLVFQLKCCIRAEQNSVFNPRVHLRYSQTIVGHWITLQSNIPVHPFLFSEKAEKVMDDNLSWPHAFFFLFNFPSSWGSVSCLSHLYHPKSEFVLTGEIERALCHILSCKCSLCCCGDTLNHGVPCLVSSGL